MENMRALLEQEFLRRNSKNQKYSLRAFGRQVGIYHATLSALMSGKRKITPKTAKKLSIKLGLDPAQSSDRPSSYFAIHQDAYNLISDWYYDAILEMTRIKRLALTPKAIAKSLGITVMEASLAISVLLRLKLIRPVSANHFRTTEENTTNILNPEFTSRAMKKYQIQVLNKSIDALENIPKNQREHTSMTMAIKKSDLPAAKNLMKKFSRDLNRYLQREGVEPDEVYQLQMSLFPLSDLTEKK